MLDLEQLRDTDPEICYFWEHLLDPLITLCQDRKDFNIGLLSPKQRLSIILTAVTEVFAILRKPVNHSLQPLDKLNLCREPQLAYDGKTQHAMAAYYNMDKIIPRIPIINIKGKTIDYSANIPPYNSQDTKPLPKANNDNN